MTHSRAYEASTRRTSGSHRRAGGQDRREDRGRGQGRHTRPRAGRQDRRRGRSGHARPAGSPPPDLVPDRSRGTAVAPRWPTEMTWALATIAALLIAYATVSRRLGRLNVSGAMFFT